MTSLLSLLPPGPFAVEPTVGQHVWRSLAAVDLHLHLSAYRDHAAAQRTFGAARADDGPAPAAAPARPRKPYPMSGGVAQLSLSGPMSKGGSPSLFDGASTVALRRQVRQAANDPDVTAILLRVDSPGGEVAGTGDLAADVRAAAQHKPLYAYAEDLCASAAYWVASQSNAVYANPGARVGSIGTYLVVPDSSGLADKLGVRVHVVRAGEHKGAGVDGAPVTDAHLAHFQGQVDDLNAQFVAAVRRGRNMTAEQAAALADGRVYVGAKAREAGLIDGVTSYDNVLAKLRAYKPPAP